MMSRTRAVLMLTLVAVFTMSSTRAQEPVQGERDAARQGEPQQHRRRPAPAELARIARGFAVSPVPLDLKNKDAALVGLGSYLVNTQGGCNDCHTNPSFAAGGDPFKGEPKQINAERYLAGGNQFGPFVSRNLTPEAGSGRPAGLTYRQFRRVMRTGIDLKNGHPEVSPLLQVMPWPLYQDMTERDLRAMYEFLRAIPSVESTP